MSHPSYSTFGIWVGGALAAREKKRRTDNPHRINTAQWAAWNMGWDAWTEARALEPKRRAS